jgi:hypothetical protein
MMKTPPNQMIDEVREALQGLRAGLIGLYDEAGADPTAPQEVARCYGINRSLTWRLSRAISASDPFSSLNHLPREQGVGLVIAAFEAAGASPETADRVRAAMRHFADIVQAHAGSRDHLESTLESMGLLERESTAATGRELAFRGNSSVWGAQARVQIAANFVGPSALGPDKLDIVNITGLIGFRRLRPSVEWSLSSYTLWDDAGVRIRTDGDFEQPGANGQQSPVLHEFCSPHMPALEVVHEEGGSQVLLPAGEVGNSAAFDCYFGRVAAGVPGTRSPGNEVGRFACVVLLPVETMVCDLIFHERLALDKTMEAVLYGFPRTTPHWPWKQPARHELPMNEQPIELAGSPPVLTTPLVPPLSKIAARVYEQMDWNPKEFRGLRLQVPYAPMGSELAMRWPLPEA